MFHPKVQRPTSDCLELVCLRTCPRRKTRHRAEKAYNAPVYAQVYNVRSGILFYVIKGRPTFRARKVSLKIASLFIDILITQFELKQTRILTAVSAQKIHFVSTIVLLKVALRSWEEGLFTLLAVGHSHNEVVSWSDDAQLGELLDIAVQKHRIRSIVTPHLRVMQTVLLR